MTEPLASRAGKVSYEGGSATLTFERHIGHPIEDVWDAITGSEPLQRWYMSKAIIEGRKDGRIELWSGSAQVHVTGRILTWEPPRVFEHERTMEPRKGIPTGERSIIRWELRPEAGGTQLRLTHTRLAPPIAVPIAPAPPFTFVISGGKPSSRITTRDWIANASFNSISPRSSTFNPARARALRVAGIGPRPIVRGSTPAAADETMRAIGGSPSSFTFKSLIIRRAAAPSLTPLEFPAVTVPPSRNAGGSFARASRDVSGRGCSSRVTRATPPFFWGTGTGTISSENLPLSIAAIALRWLSRAKRSCSSRVIFGPTSRRFSAVSR